MTTVIVKRAGTTITTFVVDDAKINRTATCRNVQSAVALETKLTTDLTFANSWVRDKESMLPMSIPSPGERKPATGW